MSIGSHASLLNELQLLLLWQTLLLLYQAFGHILCDGAVEERRLLLHQSQLVAQPLDIQIREIDSIEQDLPGCRLVPSF